MRNSEETISAEHFRLKSYPGELIVATNSAGYVRMAEKLRFSDVAYAIGTSPKSLRNWLQRNQVSLISAVPVDGRWREFDIDDIPHLALVRTLVDFGIEVRESDGLAAGLLKDAPVARDGNTGNLHIQDVEVALWPIEGGWQCLPFNGAAEAEKAISQASATLIIRVGRIVGLALQRALERLLNDKLAASLGAKTPEIE